MKPHKPRYDAAERAERHARTLAELRDGAVLLAQDAARTVARDAKARAEGRPEPAAASPALPAGRDPVEVFLRMSRNVRVLIALEAEIAATSRLLERQRDQQRRDERLPTPTHVIPRVTH